jgi:hypothetical protein
MSKDGKRMIAAVEAVSAIKRSQNRDRFMRPLKSNNVDNALIGSVYYAALVELKSERDTLPLPRDQCGCSKAGHLIFILTFDAGRQVAAGSFESAHEDVEQLFVGNRPGNKSANDAGRGIRCWSMSCG